MSLHIQIVSIGQKKEIEPMMLFYREKKKFFKENAFKERVHKVQRNEITMLGLVVWSSHFVELFLKCFDSKRGVHVVVHGLCIRWKWRLGDKTKNASSLSLPTQKYCNLELYIISHIMV